LASHNAIAAIGQAILGLLQDACPRPEFDGARFELYQSASFSKPMDEGISLYLYRVAVNTTRRNLPPRLDAAGRRFRPALPVDLFYMLTPWARTAERQHRLLGWAMRTIEDTPTLASGLLNHYAVPEHTAFSPEETVGIIQEQISIQDMFNLWDFAKHNIQVSVTYAVRLVPLDSAILESDGSLVQTRRFGVGKAVEA
jgi:Pvc16 N-terminal domain